MNKYMFFLIQIAFAAIAYGKPIEDLDAFIEKTYSEWKVPGVAVVVVKEGKVILAKGYGVVQAGEMEKVDENTIFQLASVTKTFTAAALGILVDQNKLGWDDQVMDHLPRFALEEPYATRYTTPRDLLAHRTGLPAFGGDLLGKLGYSDEEILWRIRYIDPATSFRNRAYYSNVGYFIAGEVLAQLSDASWEKSVRSTLLEPLDMERSGFAENLDHENVAYGHILKDGKPKVVPWDRTGGFSAAGAITSTASDMGNWMKMLLSGGSFNGKKILEKETVREMFRSSIPGELSFSEVPPINEFSGFDYGLGWANYHYKGEMIVEKGGGLDGIRTLIALVPERGLGITILANLNLTFLPEAIRAEFLELYLGRSGEDFQKIIREREAEVTKLFEPMKQPAHSLPPSRPLKDYAGTFENQLYGKFQVVLDQGKLALHAGPAPFKGTLTHFGGDAFVLSWPVVNSGSESVNFIFSPEGKVEEFQTETLGVFMRKRL